MKIPRVTDEMLGAVIATASSPVFVLWEDTDSVDYRANRATASFVADKFDAQVIFVSLLIDENPECARIFHHRSPGFTIFKKTEIVDVGWDLLLAGKISAALEAALERKSS